MKALIKDSKIWQWAMLCFVIAGITGFLYRLGFLIPFPFELNLDSIRHAHSHLMFFGWAALLPMYLIKQDLAPGYHAALGAKLMKISLWFSLIFGLISYPVFFLWGYHPITIGSSTIPLAAIISGMVMIGWYIFMVGYLITRYRKREFVPNVWFEGALIMLFVSSLGAWGVGFVEIIGIGGPLFGKALTHFFLATFVEGWVVLALMGLIAKALKMSEEDLMLSPAVLVGLIAIGAPLTFPYGISESMLSLNLSVTARMGGVLVAEGVLLFVYSVISSRKGTLGIWIWPLLFLGLKGVMQLIAAVSPAGLWLSEYGIRILYLHVLLLGAFTTGVTVYMMEGLNVARGYFYAVLGSVSTVIVSLLLMTSFWPAMLTGVWIYTALAIAALFPIISMCIFWWKMNKAVMKT